jgi:hypothetical protein
MTISFRVALGCVLCAPLVVADGSPGPPASPPAGPGWAAPVAGWPGAVRGRGWWRPDPNRGIIILTTVLPASFAGGADAA